MKSPTTEYPVPTMTVEAAADFASGVHGYLSASARSEDDLDAAYGAFERQFGVGRWTIEHLRKKRAKVCDVSVFAKLRVGYISLCERQVRKLQHEIAITRATSGGDDTLEDLVAEADRLAEKIAARKEALKAGVGR